MQIRAFFFLLNIVVNSFIISCKEKRKAQIGQSNTVPSQINQLQTSESEIQESLNLTGEEIISSSEASINDETIRGDRLEVGHFNIEERFDGNIFTFGSDPNISYFNYKACSEDGTSCYSGSTILRSIWLYPSLGQKPTLELSACISESYATDKNTLCTHYQPQIPSLSDFLAEKKSLLYEREALHREINAHANEAFLALYYYLSHDQTSQSCKFKGVNGDLTLTSKISNLAFVNPYLIEESFRSVGHIPSDDQIQNFLKGVNSLQTDSLSLTGNDDLLELPARTQTWGEWAWNISKKVITTGNETGKIASLFVKSLIPGTEASRLDLPPHRAANPEVFYVFGDVSRLSHRTGQTLWSLTQLGYASYNKFIYDPDAPKTSVWSKVRSAFGVASSVVSLPGYLADGLENLNENIKYLTSMIQSLPRESIEDLKQIQRNYQDLMSRYNDYFELSRQLRNVEQDIADLRIDRVKKQIEDWRKIADDDALKNILKSVESLYTRHKDQPSLRSIKQQIESIASFLSDPQVVKLRENLTAIYDLLDDKSLKKVSDISGHFNRLLRNVGILPKEFPIGWFQDSVADSTEVYRAAKSSVSAHPKYNQFIGDLGSLLEDEIRPLYDIDKTLKDSARGANQVEERAIMLSQHQIRQKIDLIKYKYSELIGDNYPELKKAFADFEAGLIAKAGIDAPRPHSLAAVNDYLDAFSHVYRQFAQRMSPEDWAKFKLNHEKLTDVLKITKPDDILGQIDRRMSEITDLSEFWPPKSALEARKLTEMLVSEVGSYTDKKAFWDKLFNTLADDIEGTRLHPVKAAKTKILTKALGIKNGQDLYDYIFKISDNPKEVGMLQKHILQELQVQEKINEARVLGIEELRRREWAYKQLWPEGSLAKSRLSRLSDLITGGAKGKVAQPYAAGVVSRLFETYIPENIKSKALQEALKKGTKVVVMSSMTGKPGQREITDIRVRGALGPEDVNWSRIVARALSLAGNNEEFLNELEMRVLEKQKLVLSHFFLNAGYAQIALGLYASHLLSIGDYELRNSEGNCSELALTVEQQKEARMHIRSLQEKIYEIDQKLFDISR